MKTKKIKYFNEFGYISICYLLPILNVIGCSQYGRGNGLPGEGLSKRCSLVAKAGLNVEVLFAPGIPISGKVKITNEIISEELTLGDNTLDMPSRGLRIKGSDGKTRPWQFTSLSGASGQAGTFQVSVEALGQVFKKDNIVVQKDECHVIPQTVTFEITSPTQTRLDDTKDYYPLDNGALFELDPKSGSGKIVGQSTIYKEIEAVRVLFFTETFGSGPSSSATRRSREEKTVSGKVKLGTFTEKGCDLGPLPAGAEQDDGGRVLYGKQ